MMQEDPFSIKSETQKLENNRAIIAFSTLNWGLVLVCNFLLHELHLYFPQACKGSFKTILLTYYLHPDLHAR